MKNKIIAFGLLAITIISMASCTATRSKYGCPMNTERNSKWRG
ncbi:hypothetical protein SAMN05444008_115105 [Cnuella takakiae]|uniref:Lipoprotein n=1 Tax=Cnuella takakiae TaxID=1302690 RepID=A0A1M5G4M2_9BACT|nr:hypothetical protein [Cnuella takakiae]SHF98770.1 hypothetical protein SAMN05444008_115105 [Cnuella takakiae]